MKGAVLDLTIVSVKGSYSLPGRCSNCGWTGEMKISLGFEAPTFGIGGRCERCPNCGCRTVGKAEAI